MKSIFWLFSLLVLCTACQMAPDANAIYASLKPHQAKVLIQFDGTDFYRPESIFTGQVDVYDTFLRLNLSDQFESNIIVSFSGENWYKQKPIKRPIFLDNQVAGSVMIGRLTDKVNRRGEGYLMTDGTISVDALSDDKVVLRLTGKVGKYAFQRIPTKWNTVQGLIVMKNPSLRLRDITRQDVFF